MTSVRLSLALAATLALTSCASVPFDSPTAGRAPVAAPATTPKLLLVSIDGLRADMLDRGITPNLSRLVDGGVRARWMTPSYPSLTFPNHYTIVTGLRPDHHGIIHNSMHEDALGSFRLSKREAVTDARWWGGEPIWVGAEKAGVRTATLSWPGSEAAIQGVRPSQWRTYDASVPDGQTIAIEDMVDPTIATDVSMGQSVGFAPLPGKRREAEKALLGAHAQYDCWTRQTLPARWHYGSNPRIPPIVCQMHEGWNALSRASVAKRSPGTRGSHGYDNALPSMRAVFIARGPSFNQGQTIAGFDNVDVYPLLARLLGVPAAPNDGDAERLLPALR